MYNDACTKGRFIALSLLLIQSRPRKVAGLGGVHTRDIFSHETPDARGLSAVSCLYYVTLTLTPSYIGTAPLERDWCMVPPAVADQRGDPTVERRVAAAAPVVADEGGDLRADRRADCARRRRAG